MYATDHAKSIEMCESLLEEPNLDVAVRVGDVYAFIIHHQASCGNFDKVSSLIGTFILGVELINNVYQ